MRSRRAVPASAAVLASAVVLAVSGVLAGCRTTSAAGGPAATSPAATSPAAPRPRPSGSQSAPSGTDWPTYHRDAARTGAAPATPAAGPLAIAWRRHFDGAVYGQPLVIGGLVIAATEGDTVYGLDRATGRVRWHVSLGTPVPLSALPCGDIDPLGITGTPVYDPATRLVYAVAETTGFHHILAGIAVPSGKLIFQRDVPTPDGHPRYDQQRAALALDRGRVYVAFGGLYGDCGPYQGSVNGIPASGHGPMISYKVPTARAGGMWAAGGPVVAPSGTIYVSLGNGAATAPPYDGSDSVTALTPGLRRTGIFAPSTWPADNASDLDLGSSAPALLRDGTMLADGKRGTGYLLNANHLAGVGSQLAQAPVCGAFGGMAVAGTVAYVPCEGGGMAAVDTSGGTIKVLWRGPATAAGSPVTGGGAVWVPDWNAGVLYQLDPGTGHVRHKIRLGSALPHFASPSLSGTLALIGTMHGVVAVSGA
jgi:outer membrane protein assembly factor BamB